jgi:hypothetical protein
MEEQTQVVENLIFFYQTKKGQKLYTPNVELAEVRAHYYGTDNVYVEKNNQEIA